MVVRLNASLHFIPAAEQNLTASPHQAKPGGLERSSQLTDGVAIA